MDARDIGEAFRRAELARLPALVTAESSVWLEQATLWLQHPDLWRGLACAEWWVNLLVRDLDELVFEPRYGYRVYRTIWYRERWRRWLTAHGITDDPAEEAIVEAANVLPYVDYGDWMIGSRPNLYIRRGHAA